MKRIVQTLLVLLIVPSALFSQNETSPIISVLDFETSGVSSSEMRLFVDYISSHIVEIGEYRVIDRAQRKTLLEEIEFSLTDCTEEKCQLEIGQLLSANQIVVGSVGKIANRYLLNIRLIEVGSGETLNSVSDKYSNMDDLIDHSRELIHRLIGREIVAKSEKQPELNQKATEQDTLNKATAAWKEPEGIEVSWDDPSLARAPTHAPKPIIPSWVSRQKLNLHVVVSFELFPKGGEPLGIKIDQSSGYKEVDDAVLEAFLRWRFAPSVQPRFARVRIKYHISSDLPPTHQPSHNSL